MDVAIETDSSAAALSGIRTFAYKQVEDWAQQCAHFRKWEREELLLKNPSAKTAQQHRKMLRYLITCTDLMISGGADPEIHDTQLAGRLKVIRQRLQDSWSQFCEPMSKAESDRILAQAFPNES